MLQNVCHQVDILPALHNWCFIKKPCPIRNIELGNKLIIKKQNDER